MSEAEPWVWEPPDWWGTVECPDCKTDWEPNDDRCRFCGLTIEAVAERLHTATSERED